MRLLVIGGTRFIGRQVVLDALAAGHAVTVFHRGLSGNDLFREQAAGSNLSRVIGDRNDPHDLAQLAVAGKGWDATIDTCAYVPRQVIALADVLGSRGGRYLLVSSTAVYADPTPSYDESAPLIELEDPATEAVNGGTYGGLKVLCERAASERFGSSALIVRPTYVVGPQDYTWRFPWWVDRLARGGDVLAPGPRSDAAQVIDVRDLARWILRLVAPGEPLGLRRALHAVGPASPLTWGGLLHQVASVVAPAGTTLRWITPAEVAAASLGPLAFPLWQGDAADRARSAANPAAAKAAGLTLRPLAETVADTWAWVRSLHARRAVPLTDVGIERAVERALLVTAGLGGGARGTPGNARGSRT